ncbi:hypothetical protein [Streptomyces sp. 3N207]|uniref:hypothetical protein n=1 Tax=Streptomyces sp. 3N207 TaxID=3457417 RepID=UPI003FD06FFF
MNRKFVVHLLEPAQRRSAGTASAVLTRYLKASPGALTHLGVSQDAYLSPLYWARTDVGWYAVLLMSRNDHVRTADEGFRDTVGLLATHGLQRSFPRVLDLAEACIENGMPPEWMALVEAPHQR